MSASGLRLNLLAGLASILVAGTLVALKLWAFSATGSLAVAASLADSALDLVASAAGFAAMVYAMRPADEDHDFGHGSAEDLFALGQAALIAVSAASILWAAVLRLAGWTEHTLSAEGTGITVMATSVVLTAGLVMGQGMVARRTGSRVVTADRMHYLADLVPNAGAIVALAAAQAFGLQQIDSVIALAAGAMLALGAWRIGIGPWHALMDGQADPQTLDTVRRIAADWPGILGFHDLKSRTAGSRAFIQIHVEIDGALSLREAHDIGAGFRRAVLDALPHADLIVHKDPA
jgi:ferrous-iron efflux pump FieF